MLQAARRDGEPDRLLRRGVLFAVQRVDEPRSERVAAAEAVDDVADLIGGVVPRRVERSEKGSGCAVEEHCSPVVVVGGNAFAQRDRDFRRFRKPREQLFRNGAITVDIQFPRLDLGCLRPDSEHVRGVLLIADDPVDERDDLPHALLRKRARRGAGPPFPEFLAEVQVAGDRNAALRRFFRKCERRKKGVFAQ